MCETVQCVCASVCVCVGGGGGARACVSVYVFCLSDCLSMCFVHSKILVEETKSGGKAIPTAQSRFPSQVLACWDFLTGVVLLVSFLVYLIKTDIIELHCLPLFFILFFGSSPRALGSTFHLHQTYFMNKYISSSPEIALWSSINSVALACPPLQFDIKMSTNAVGSGVREKLVWV